MSLLTAYYQTNSQSCKGSLREDLLFIDEHLSMLQTSSYGCTVGSLNCGNPTLADDLCLVSPNMRSLQEQVLISEQYASRWRYEFNQSKCKLFVLGDKRNTTYTIQFGNTNIQSVPLVTHVGIDLHSSFKGLPLLRVDVGKVTPHYFQSY